MILYCSRQNIEEKGIRYVIRCKGYSQQLSWVYSLKVRKYCCISFSHVHNPALPHCLWHTLNIKQYILNASLFSFIISPAPFSHILLFFPNGSLSICILQNVGGFFLFFPSCLYLFRLLSSFFWNQCSVLFCFSCIPLRSKSLSRKALFLKVIRLMLSIGKYFQVIGAWNTN